LGAGNAIAQTYDTTFAYSDSNAPFQLPAAEAFKNYIEVATDGDFVVNITTVGGLGGDEREVLDQQRLGELHFNTPTAGALSGAFPSAQVWNLPFLFSGRHVAWSLLQDREYIDTVNQQMLDNTNGQLRFLGAAENSIRHLYTTSGPVRVPPDLDEYDIKIRTMQAPMHQAIWSSLGAPSVVALPATERYSGLQTGLIDATEGGLSSAWNAGLLEVADYVTLTAHMFDATSYTVNNDFFESLPEDYQKIVEEAVALAVYVQNAYALTEENKALAEIIAAGNTVVDPTQEERMAWRELAEPVGREFLQDVVDQEFLQATMDAIANIEEGFYVQ
jgi:TRAP-type C4-dicarboxylate transport system substrate-binding protein